MQQSHSKQKRTLPKPLPIRSLWKNEEFRQRAIAVASEIWMILAPLTGRCDAGRSERLGDTSK